MWVSIPSLSSPKAFQRQMTAHMSISIVKMPELIVTHGLCLSSMLKQIPSSPPLGFDLRALKPVGGLRMSMLTDLEDRADLTPNEEQQPKERY
jgi:hypothetical protein